ncbi:hypothetical protein FGK63_03980 [Ruegeria sediminis]|uniref:Zinc finger/thioredoxin putative domain-containing protein n=1 Tax=Ruegeria sediminis TaxID=2583820 RepID=A0ABY2X4B7_9RHOB|nr:zinc-ribbon domain-containing protein [Ruegeria sediminis]TMV10231.1 hypothetical protein FGK63_03980 [Ruegeria sediminis]
MRLTCPNCGAQYEVPDEVIPKGGRDVQCSNCDKTWFQNAAGETPAEPAPPKPEEPRQEAPPPEPPAAEPEKAEQGAEAAPEPEKAEPEAEAEPEKVEPEAEPAAAAEPSRPEPASPRSVDPAVANILREEAAHEAELRAREADKLEVQQDLGLEAHAGKKPGADAPPAAKTVPEESRRAALPDIEEINSTLRGDAASDKGEQAEQQGRKSSGFLRGFALVVILGVVLMMVYSNAQQIGEAVPQADPVLDSYVSMVDQARLWLEAQADAVMNPAE